MRSFLAFALLALACAGGQEPRPAPRHEVVVLATLHAMHATTPAYDFDALGRAIEQVRPGVLAVELTRADLEGRRPQRTKVEYARTVFPLADRLKLPMVPLEPDEPQWSELVGGLREATAALARNAPEKAAAFDTFADAVYAEVVPRWTSPSAVNDEATDLVFAVKHRAQTVLYGIGEGKSWDRWNRHFARRILEAARANPGKRVVALVGVEHGYWLRRELAKEKDVEVLDAAAMLAR